MSDDVKVPGNGPGELIQLDIDSTSLVMWCELPSDHPLNGACFTCEENARAAMRNYVNATAEGASMTWGGFRGSIKLRACMRGSGRADAAVSLGDLVQDVLRTALSEYTKARRSAGEFAPEFDEVEITLKESIGG